MISQPITDPGRCDQKLLTRETRHDDKFDNTGPPEKTHLQFIRLIDQDIALQKLNVFGNGIVFNIDFL